MPSGEGMESWTVDVFPPANLLVGIDAVILAQIRPASTKDVSHQKDKQTKVSPEETVLRHCCSFVIPWNDIPSNSLSLMIEAIAPASSTITPVVHLFDALRGESSGLFTFLVKAEREGLFEFVIRVRCHDLVITQRFLIASAVDQQRSQQITDANVVIGLTISLQSVEQKPLGAVYRGTAHGDESTDKSAYLYQVWFATNRAPVSSSDGNPNFSNTPDARDAVHYGVCSVRVPRTHRFGSTGKQWWHRWMILQLPDDQLRLERTTVFADRSVALANLRQELVNGPVNGRQILVYLHGYNVSFEEAALRAAQLGFDLKITGITAFFSWPSCGRAEGYLADEDRISASERAITTFLCDIADSCGSGNLHIIAHSMGNRALARAIQRIGAIASIKSSFNVGNLILAAPDIEVSLFRELSEIYSTISRRTTMYVSPKDKALGLSKWLHSSMRAGFTPPVTILPAIDTIEVTNLDIASLGHSYYAEAEGVLQDIYEVINFNVPPRLRARTRPAFGITSEEYWVIV